MENERMELIQKFSQENKAKIELIINGSKDFEQHEKEQICKKLKAIRANISESIASLKTSTSQEIFGQLEALFENSKKDLDEIHKKVLYESQKKNLSAYKNTKSNEKFDLILFIAIIFILIVASYLLVVKYQYTKLGFVLISVGTLFSKHMVLIIDSYFHIRATNFSNRGLEVEALHYFSKLNPRGNYPNSWNNMGTALSKLGRFEEAIKSYDKAILLYNKSFDYYNNKGCALLELQRLDEATEVFNIALELNPNNALAINNVGNLYLKRSQFEKASSMYDKAIAINPDNIIFLTNKGICLHNLERHEEALKLIELALRINPSCKITQILQKNVMTSLANKGN